MEIPIVNEKDEVICYKERDTEEQMDLYRVSALWLTNSKGEVLLSRRALTKSHNPGEWSTAVAGTVEEGETYEENIVKEIKEEIGLELDIKKGAKLLRCSKDRPDNYFCQWYTAKTDIKAKDIVFDEKEVAEVKWFSKEELIKKIKENPKEFADTVQSWARGEVTFD
jgi:isopentenyl-diphosphate Delta-isomerase